MNYPTMSVSNCNYDLMVGGAWNDGVLTRMGHIWNLIALFEIGGKKTIFLIERCCLQELHPGKAKHSSAKP